MLPDTAAIVAWWVVVMFAILGVYHVGKYIVAFAWDWLAADENEEPEE